MKIYMKVSNYPKTYIDKARNVKEAEAKIARYMREDRYEIEVEKYMMPKSWEGKYPEYTYEE